MLEVRKLSSIMPYGANTYLISSCGESAVIDPAAPPPKDAFFGKLKYVLLTHSHFDHILTIDSWVALGAMVCIANEELSYLPSGDLNCYSLFLGCDKGYHGKAIGLSDGDTIRLGDEDIIFLNTPGHTPGSGVYLCKDKAFVGDTVFAGGGYGRYDLPGGDADSLGRSISRIIAMDSDIVLYPGHGGITTVSEYKKDFNR